MEQSLGPNYLKWALLRRKYFNLPYKSNASFRFQSKGSQKQYHNREGAFQKQPFLLLPPIHIAIYRLGYCNTGHPSALSFWDIREIGKIYLSCSGGAEHKGFSSLFVDRWIGTCSLKRSNVFNENSKRILWPLLENFKH